MNKKGFTLMELLAVIVILAVIALIATPEVLNIIEDSKRSAAEDSARIIAKSAETYYMSETTLQGEEVASIDLTGDTLKYKGEKPDKGYVSFDEKGNSYLKMYINGYCVESNYDNTVESEKAESENCEINTVSIPLNLDGGELDKSALTYEEGSTLGTLPEPTKKGYTFKGWYDGNGNPVTSETVVAKGLRLTASWEANTYTVTFKNGDEIVETREVTYGQEYGELPVATSTGLTFKGWYTTNGTNILSMTRLTIAEDHTVIAQWEALAENFSYTGGYQKYVVPNTGNYKIELWGAGGSIHKTQVSAPDNISGRGAYTAGTIFLEKGTILYIYVGEKGGDSSNSDDSITASFNGGGKNGSVPGYYRYVSGSGATDIRYFSTTYDDDSSELLWNSDIGLKSRIMVAAGGTANEQGGGGLTGYSGRNASYSSYYTNGGKGGSQIAAGTGGEGTYGDYGYSGYDGQFGIGGTGGDGRYQRTYNYSGAGGSGGYYGGGGAAGGGFWSAGSGGAGSGSSFISGHTGCVALASSASLSPKSGCTDGTTDNACSIHYSGYSFTDTKMIDGIGKVWTTEVGEQEHMPNPEGGYYELGKGHEGNGHARITFLG